LHGDLRPPALRRVLHPLHHRLAAGPGPGGQWCDRDRAAARAAGVHLDRRHQRRGAARPRCGSRRGHDAGHPGLRGRDATGSGRRGVERRRHPRRCGRAGPAERGRGARTGQHAVRGRDEPGACRGRSHPVRQRRAGPRPGERGADRVRAAVARWRARPAPGGAAGPLPRLTVRGRQRDRRPRAELDPVAVGQRHGDVRADRVGGVAHGRAVRRGEVDDLPAVLAARDEHRVPGRDTRVGRPEVEVRIGAAGAAAPADRQLRAGQLDASFGVVAGEGQGVGVLAVACADLLEPGPVGAHHGRPPRGGGRGGRRCGQVVVVTALLAEATGAGLAADHARLGGGRGGTRRPDRLAVVVGRRGRVVRRERPGARHRAPAGVAVLVVGGGVTRGTVRHRSALAPRAARAHRPDVEAHLVLGGDRRAQAHGAGGGVDDLDDPRQQPRGVDVPGLVGEGDRSTEARGRRRGVAGLAGGQPLLDRLRQLGLSGVVRDLPAERGGARLVVGPAGVDGSGAELGVRAGPQHGHLG
ncbi:collagen alpha-1(I) chain-like, partial [Herrania umbratica]|uniref:Collagen alpha-1(I) chain-like n=1 Tax=Herrania umbratica TaxID=108875 RepID=A0A6J1BML5_9ROSI